MSPSPKKQSSTGVEAEQSTYDSQIDQERIPIVPSVIDADIHVEVPGIWALFPYLEEHWVEHFTNTQGDAGELADRFPRTRAGTQRLSTIPHRPRTTPGPVLASRR